MELKYFFGGATSLSLISVLGQMALRKRHRSLGLVHREDMSVRRVLVFVPALIWPGVCVTASVHFLLIFSCPPSALLLGIFFETLVPGLNYTHNTKVLIKCKRRVYFKKHKCMLSPEDTPWSASFPV